MHPLTRKKIKTKLKFQLREFCKKHKLDYNKIKLSEKNNFVAFDIFYGDKYWTTVGNFDEKLFLKKILYHARWELWSNRTDLGLRVKTVCILKKKKHTKQINRKKKYFKKYYKRQKNLTFDE